MIASVIVTPKPVVNDPQGATVKRGLGSLGFGEVTDVRVGKYIELTLAVESEEDVRERIDQMCRRLLANRVIEDYRIELHSGDEGAMPPDEST